MTQPDPARSKVHIKAIADEFQREFLNTTDSDDAVNPSELFASGMLAGLATAVRIFDGATAEQALEAMDRDLATAHARQNTPENATDGAVSAEHPHAGGTERPEGRNGLQRGAERLGDEQFQLRVASALHRSAEEDVTRVIDKLEHLAGLDVAKEPGPKGDGIRWTLRMIRSAVKGRRP